MSKRRVLIIGSSGNLGGQLQQVLRSEDIILWDREDLDISKEEDVFLKIKDLKPNIIINTAAYNAVDKCEEDKREFVLAKKINGEAPGYLAQVALETNTLLVHYSTDYVFDGGKKDGYKESDLPNPINNYGRSKLLGEKKIIEQMANGLRAYIIRTSKLFGPKGESEVAKPSFFDVMLELSKEKNALDVVDAEKSCFTYTLDLAKATKKLIDSKQISGIYHITNENPCTWYESVLELFKIKNIKTKINPVSSSKFPRPAKRPKYSVLKNTKLVKLRDYKDALREYLKE